MSDHIKENDAASMAPTDTIIGTQRRAIKPDSEFNGHPCFNIDCPHEYTSFNKGVKGFLRWSQHTKSEKVRQWANTNPNKNFYVTHNDNYTMINRKK